VTITLDDVYDLGGLFYQWETATAAAASVFHIDPFDEPNVQESKDNTKRLLGEFESTGRIEFDSAPILDGPEKIYGNVPPAASSLGVINNLFSQRKHGDYLAIMAYLPRVPEVEELLERLRSLVRNRLKIPVTVGFGPRFLHSTGQFHKGGTPNGLFLQLVHTPAKDFAIPEESYGFATLFRAQAAGDYLSLKKRNKPVVSIHFSDYTAGLNSIIEKTI